MSTLAGSLGESKKPWMWIAIAGGILLVWGVIAFSPMRHDSFAPTSQTSHKPMAQLYSEARPEAVPVASPQVSVAVKEQALAAADAAGGRKIIRTSSMEMIVQHPADVADKITALAEGLGGYLVSADGGGQNASVGMLTIRVPAAQFETARAEIRKLGLRVESEKVD